MRHERITRARSDAKENVIYKVMSLRADLGKAFPKDDVAHVIELFCEDIP